MDNIPTSSFRVRYQTKVIGDTDIHLRTLRDKCQYNDDLGLAQALGISSAQWPLFGVIWNSSIVLANLMNDFDIEGKRILEIGCGLALSSIMINKRHGDITATDYHPEVEDFLKRNALLNEGEIIPYHRIDWSNEKSTIGKFDLIIGSDVLYEQEHIILLSQFIKQHANERCEVIIVDPGRKHHNKFTKEMLKLNYTHSQSKDIKASQELDDNYHGLIIRYQRS
jgi:predicted nicotinamide N-methyase